MVIWIDREAYLNAAEACEALEVKPQTLYAYVSRGLLRSYRRGIRRQRLYLKREIDALLRLTAGRARRPRRVGLPPADQWIGDR